MLAPLLEVESRQFGRLEVQDQDDGRFGIFWTISLGLEMVRTPTESSHGLPSVTICVLIFSALKDNSYTRLGLSNAGFYHFSSAA